MKKHTKITLGLIAGAVIVGSVVAGTAAGSSSDDTSLQPVGTAVGQVAGSPTTTARTRFWQFPQEPTPTVEAPPAAAGPATTVSDGTYEVGADMVAGKYKGQCPAWGYWARLRSDNTSDIITNDLIKAAGPMTFTANKGEYVSITGCTFAKVG